MIFSTMGTDKLIERLFNGRKSINWVIDGLSTISPGFEVESRDAIASKKLGMEKVHLGENHLY